MPDPGIRPFTKRWRTPHEDYIAGEIDQPDRLVIRRVFDGNVDGAELHMLSYLGQTWGRGAPRFSSEQIITWTRNLVNQDGAGTWDVPVQTNGLISQPFLEQLGALSRALSPAPSAPGSSVRQIQ